MSKLIFLGTSNAIPNQNHDNSHLAVVGESANVLIDTGNHPIVRLEAAGIEILNITDLILTHFHPDHISSAPLLLMDSWLLGRWDKLILHGYSSTLMKFQEMMDLYGWSTWPGFFPVEFNQIPEIESSIVIENNEFRILSSPVRHLIPTMGLRMEFIQSNKVVVYSCDTSPCEEVERMAEGADVLIHEASGASKGHTSAAQAGEIASVAGVAELYLIHYPTRSSDPGRLIEDAGKKFAGPVKLAKDCMELVF